MLIFGFKCSDLAAIAVLQTARFAYVARAAA